MFGLARDFLLPRDSYYIASFYFCILYCNQPAYTAILKELYSRSSRGLKWCFKGFILQCKEWDICVLFNQQLWNLKSYRYAHLRGNEEQCIADTLGINGVLIWLHAQLILTCLCSKWRNK